VSEEVCPVCGKKTGGRVPCPYCLTDTSRKIKLTWVWLICTLLAALGAVAIVMHSRASVEEPISISEIDPWMDYSYGWVEGTVTSGPLYGRNYISFSVCDFSSDDLERSTVEVRAYSPVSEELLSAGAVPRVGDRVKVFGQMRVSSEKDKMITISIARDLRITPSEPVTSTPSEIMRRSDLLFRRMTVEGIVAGMRSTGSAYVYYLSDGTGEIQLYIPNGLGAYVERRSLGVEALDRVRVSGGVSVYRGTPQLNIARFSDIEVIGRENVQRVGLAGLVENMVGSYVRVSGRIILSESVGTTTSLKIVKRVLWLDAKNLPRVHIDEEVFQGLSRDIRDALVRGSRVELVGKVERRDERLAVTFVGPQAPTIEEGVFTPPAVDNLEVLADEDLALVSGTVREVENRTKGLLPPDRILTVATVSGSARVLIPNFIWERLVEVPGEGDRIAVVGKIAAVGGERVLQVCSTGDVWREV
jgi:DNA/RNA endonuclease YhcR with UshA esterase domain